MSTINSVEGGLSSVVNSRRAWSSKEIVILRKRVGSKTSAEIGREIGRTSDSVKHQVRKIGLSLKLRGDKCSWTKYSDHDCELARCLHSDGMPVKIISEKLEIPSHALHSILYFKRA